MIVHPTAVIDESVCLGVDVELRPYTIIEAGVIVGDRCRIGPHAHLRGPLEVGDDCEIGFSVSLGHDPQVLGRPGPWGGVRIGNRCILREFSQVHRAMDPDAQTVLGDDCFLMACAHVAHDCRVGNRVVIVNNVLLGGHVQVGDRAFFGGGSVVHQFTRIGELAMIGGNAAIQRDVPPFTTAVGVHPARLVGLNLVGLRRAGVDGDIRIALKAAFRKLFRSSLPLAERLAAVEPGVPEVERLVRFVRSTKRGVIGFGGVG